MCLKTENRLYATRVVFLLGKSTQHHRKSLKGPNCDRYVCLDSLIAVADGVNSVQNEGVNPVKFPAQLLDKCLALFNERQLDPQGFERTTNWLLSKMKVKLRDNSNSNNNSLFSKRKSSQFLGQLICRAASETTELGASTLCLGLLQDSTLHVANVGDSGMCIFRLSQTMSQTISQTTSQSMTTAGSRDGDNRSDMWMYKLMERTTPGFSCFNHPYQLMRMNIDGVMPSDGDIAKGVAFGLTLNSFEVEVS